MKTHASLVVACLLAASSCVPLGKSCTEIGCIDGASVTIRSSDGNWPEGSYVLTLGVDEATHACAFKLPEHLPSSGGQAQLSCEPDLGYPGASIDQDGECQEHRDEDSVSQSCTPIAGQYTLRVGVSGTPATLDLALTRDGSALVDETVNLMYTATRPNGEGCDPLCHQASTALTF